MLNASNPFVLAPMAGITDMPFRRLIKHLGAGVVISEFVSAHGILHPSAKAERYLAYHKEESPVGIQIFGDDPEILAKAAYLIQERGVDFVDINLGCPVPKVTRKLSGSAWLCRPVELGRMLAKVKSVLRIPLTIKIRTGWDAESVNALEVSRIAQEEGIHWVAIHGRTRAQGYAGRADWDLIREVAENVKIPIIGNGDILNGAMAAARLKDSRCSGVMIGRAALKNPWIFKESVEALEQLEALSVEQQMQASAEFLESYFPITAGSLPVGKTYYERKIKKLQPLPIDFSAKWIRIRADRNPLYLIEKHLEYLREIYEEERVIFQMRKFLAWYAAGYPGAKEFRKFIFTHSQFQEILAEALKFFERIQSLGVNAEDLREQEPVLMSGHG